jgi:hypothetical protein
MALGLVRSMTNWAASRVAKGVYVLMAAFALTWASSPLAMSAGLTEYALLQAKYESGMQRVVPSFKKNYGKYLGSGAGKITGKVSGSVAWDLYEEQSDPAAHVTQFVGRITAPDHSKIDFETAGFFVPRQADKAFWDLTSAIRFYDAEGRAYRDLAGKIGVWVGAVHIAGDNFVHTYKIYVPGQ